MDDEGSREGDGELIDREPLAGVLSEPARRSILAALAMKGGRALSPAEIAVELEMGLSRVSYHARVLAEMGLLRLDGDRLERGAREHFYRLTTLPSQGASRPPV